MKKTIIAAMCTCTMLAPFLAGAQRVLPVVHTRYAPSVTKKVHEVAGSIMLSAPSQLWLAGQYHRQDSLQVLLIARGETVKNLKTFTDSTDKAIAKAFKQMLTGTEKAAFETFIATANPQNPIIKGRDTEKADMGSQFGIALLQHQQLQLKDAQIDSLLLKAIEFKNKLSFARSHPDSGYFDRHGYESTHMKAILTHQQYSQVLLIRHLANAKVRAGNTWHELETKGIAGNYNKDSTKAALVVYYTMGASIMDMYAHDQPTKDRLLKDNAAKIPGALAQLNRLKRGGGNAGNYAW